MSLTLDPATVERARRSLLPLLHDPDADRIGLAVSGGPDSVALLLLAAAALPVRVAAASVDHGFRPDSRAEAEEVADLCARLGVPHDILTLDWAAPATNRQSLARAARYAALARWAAERGLAAVATAHHLDDQAETLLMRLHRGAGLGGLSGIRTELDYAGARGERVRLIRPLLGWRKAELDAIPAALGLRVADDPANHDPAHDRTAARHYLHQGGAFPDRRSLAASVAHLAQAEAALAWSAARLLDERIKPEGTGFRLETADVPAELRRRLLLLVLERTAGAARLRGERVARALRLLDSGRVATLSGAVVRPAGSCWLVSAAPPRRKS